MRVKAFTLAELLIALVILGIIATFTIPKVLQGSASNQKNAVAKEVASAIAEAYSAYKLENMVTASTGARDLTPYFNYVRWDTTTLIDDRAPLGSWQCSNADPCVLLHNGAIMTFHNHCFGDTNSNNVIYFGVDPDAEFSNNAEGKALHYALYYDGRLTTVETMMPASESDWNCDMTTTPENPVSNSDPPWFSWN